MERARKYQMLCEKNAIKEKFLKIVLSNIVSAELSLGEDSRKRYKNELDYEHGNEIRREFSRLFREYLMNDIMRGEI